MGQYYRPVILEYPLHSTSKYKVLNRTVDGQYGMAKLTEHSWFGNPLCDTVGHMLYKNPLCVAWIGDYAEEEELQYNKTLSAKDIHMADVWDVEGIGLHSFDFDWKDKYIINLTKKSYINVNKYWNGSMIEIGKERKPWVLNPIPILTSIGNGRGGGDYKGLCMDYVGNWSGDAICIEDEPIPYCEELIIAFKEECYCE